ncbi:MAG: hypothetical protein ACREFV_02205 [Acetobacteraceae bacterium]
MPAQIARLLANHLLARGDDGRLVSEMVLVVEILSAGNRQGT